MTTQLQQAVKSERESIVRYLRYWAQCNKEAFPEQAIAAEGHAERIAAGAHVIGPWNRREQKEKPEEGDG